MKRVRSAVALAAGLTRECCCGLIPPARPVTGVVEGQGQT